MPTPRLPLRRPASTAGPRPAPALLVVTSLYPTPDMPQAGAFVARRVAALREAGVRVVVTAPASYRVNLRRRLVGLAGAALTRRGGFGGVEGHVLYPAGSIAVLAARLRRVPVVLYAHGADVLEAPRHGRHHGLLARLTARSADAVVTNSQSMAEAVAGLGVTASVVPPGVDFERFRQLDRARMRERLGLPAEAKIALYLGGFIERKGPDVFAEALRLAPGWQGVAVGEGELQRSLAAAGTLRVFATVQPDAVPEWLSAADVVVVPSRREPLGLAAVEALACGVPVIASAVGGLCETVRDGLNGLLVPPGDPAALAAALDRLADDRFRAGLAAAARESVAEHDLRRTTRAMAAIWRRLGVELATPADTTLGDGG